MEWLKGNRKFFVVLFSLLGSFILTTLAILTYEGTTVIGIIGSIGGTITAIQIPFVSGNISENKSKAVNGK